MDILKTLRKKIWFYKEYFIIGTISVTLLTWVILALGFVSTSSSNLSRQKSAITQIKKLNSNNKKLQIKLPNTFQLSGAISSTGEIQQKVLINNYKNYLQVLNDIKGSFKLKFYFYEKEQKIKNVKIQIYFISKDKVEWLGEQNLILTQND